MSEPTESPATPVMSAIARLCAWWCATLALTLVFVIGVCMGIEAPTALLRAGCSALIAWILGRWIGTWVGRHLAPVLVREARPDGERR